MFGGWGVGGLYSGGSSIDGDSILIALQLQSKAVEGVERNAWKLWEIGGSRGGHCILCIFCSIKSRCLVYKSEFDKRRSCSKRCVSRYSVEIKVEWSEWSNLEARKWTEQLYCLTQVHLVWSEVSVGICSMWTVDKTRVPVDHCHVGYNIETASPWRITKGSRQGPGSGCG